MIACARNPCGAHSGGCHYIDCINNPFRCVQPQVPNYTMPPAPTFTPQGCICPPTSEKTCEAISCPRRNPFKQGLSGGVQESAGS